MVLKTVIFVLPISIIVIKVGDVFLLPYSNNFTQQYEIENELFRLSSFNFLLLIPFNGSVLRQEVALGSTTILNYYWLNKENNHAVNSLVYFLALYRTATNLNLNLTFSLTQKSYYYVFLRRQFKTFSPKP